MRIFSLTTLGKKVSGDISTPHSDEKEILLALHAAKSADVDELSVDTGIKRSRTSSILRKLCSKRLCVELTASRGDGGGEI